MNLRMRFLLGDGLKKFLSNRNLLNFLKGEEPLFRNLIGQSLKKVCNSGLRIQAKEEGASPKETSTKI